MSAPPRSTTAPAAGPSSTLADIVWGLAVRSAPESIPGPAARPRMGPAPGPAPGDDYPYCSGPEAD